MFRKMPKKSEELFIQMTTSPINDGELIEHQEIMMHDVNIEEITKAKLSILALSLFSTDDGELMNIRIQWCMISILKK